MSLSLYIHIPFCETKCPFCSFAVAVNQAAHVEEYLDALEREAAEYKGAGIATCYVGGGTPSFLNMAQTDRLFNIVRDHFLLADAAEISFECNPESLSRDKAVLLKRLGVTRISLGVQSFSNRSLEYLGRGHRAEDARRAFEILREVGFDNVNVDMIYGLAGQSAQEAETDLDAILALGSEHVSIYALTIEERSLFFARKFSSASADDPDPYQRICERLESAGVLQYEISNFSRPGFESRHNINYWQGGEYIGLGMAAHSHWGGRRFWNADTLSSYLSAMSQKGRAMIAEEILPPSEKMMETFLFGLRMNKGVDVADLHRRFGVELAEEKREALESFIEMGLLEEDGMVIRTTARGRVVLDEISARLV